MLCRESPHFAARKRPLRADGQDGQMIAYGAIEGMSDRSRSDDHCRDFGHRQFDGAAAEATRWTEEEPGRAHDCQQLLGETTPLPRPLAPRILHPHDPT